MDGVSVGIMLFISFLTSYIIAEVVRIRQKVQELVESNVDTLKEDI